MSSYNPFSRKQIKVLTWWCNNSRYKDKDALICDGAVRSGKTFCMSISFVAWAFSKFNNISLAICGKTIRSLKRNVIVPLMKNLGDLGFSVELKKSENILLVNYNGMTNRFYLFGGKDEMSASLIQGITLGGVFFDEVALMPRSFVEQALARCSVEGSTFWFNCNPEYPGHWFYREWIKKSEIKNALYIHFEMNDNPSLSKRMIARYESLYSGAFYERFVKGRWVATTGAVYPFMSEDNAFVDVPKVEFEEYAVSCDYGTVNPASFGLWGRYKERWYRIKEYYFNSRVEGFQKTDEEHYSSLVELVGDVNVSRVVVDPSAASFIETIKRHQRFAVIPARNNVLDGIRKVSTALKDHSINICTTCKDSMREFSLYRWDDKNGCDSPVKENDHAMDDIRYFVTTILDSGSGFVAVAATR